MTQRGLETLTTWVRKHVDPDLKYSDAPHRARMLAAACRLDVGRCPKALAEVEEEVGDLELMFRALLSTYRDPWQPVRQPHHS